MVAAQAAGAPERVAVRDAAGSWTYAELLARADDLGVLLRRAGVRPGDRVGIHLDRTRDLVAGLLAALRAGCAYLPLDPEYPADRLRFMIEDAGPTAVLTRRGLPEPAHGDGTRLVHVDDAPGTPSGADTGPAPVGRAPDRPAFVIYTSGSTGTPKGAVLAHRGIVNILRHSRDAFGFTADDSVLAMAAFSFDFAQLELLLPLISGGTVHLVDRAVARDPELLEAALDARRASFVMGTPSMFAALTAYGWRPPRGISIVSGGESLPPALAEALAPAGALWNIYGPTETSVFSLYERVPTSGGPGTAPSGSDVTTIGAPSGSDSTIGAPSGSDITIGRPVPHTVVEILRHGERCADGETGEIHLGGPGLALGYLDRPELTAERFPADPFRPGERLYRTGDLGRRLPDGRIAYEGRADDQVKIRGHRVEPAEVEGWLLRHPSVRAAAVVAERGHHALRLVAYVVSAEGAGLDVGVLGVDLGTHAVDPDAHAVDPDAHGVDPGARGVDGVGDGVGAGLRAHLARHLPAHALPHRIVAVPEIPLSPNGKTDRRALREAARPRSTGADGLAGVWRDVLGVADVTAEDNFFALGGDSLSAMEMTIRARDLGIVLRVADLYGARTFGELADTVEARGPAASASATPAVAAELPTALSPAQLRFLEWDYRDADHYNVSLLLDVADTVDRDALREALDALAERHPALRLRLTGPADAPVPVTDRTARAPLTWHELPGTGDGEGAVERAFLKEADRLQQSLSLREGPVWRAAFFAGHESHRLLLVLHHFIADGMSLKILARDLGVLYAAAVGAEQGAVSPAPASSWAAHAGTLRRFANGPLDAFFVRRWEALPWSRCAPLPADRPGGSMHLSHIRAFDTEVPLPAGSSAAQQEELLISALAAALAEESGTRGGAVEVCRHGRNDLTGGPGHFDAVGWLNSITPYVLALPDDPGDPDDPDDPDGPDDPVGPGDPGDPDGPGGDPDDPVRPGGDPDDPGDRDARTAAALRAQITEIRAMEQTWGALRHLHDDAAVRDRLAALPAPDVYLNFLGSHMHELETAGPFRPRHGDVGTEMTLDRTQPYRIKVYAETAADTVRLKWQYSADVDDESRIRRVATSCGRLFQRLARPTAAPYRH
nr:amino acid adenylation domain-containing protein [Streptomyces typhae]